MRQLQLHRDLDSNIRPRPRYTIGDALDDWLSDRLAGVSVRTVKLYEGTIAKVLRARLGSVRLAELTAGDVDAALSAVAAGASTRTVQISHNVLVRGIRHAERHDLVRRNVAALIKPPRGQRDGSRI